MLSNSRKRVGIEVSTYNAMQLFDTSISSKADKVDIKNLPDVRTLVARNSHLQTRRNFLQPSRDFFLFSEIRFLILAISMDGLYSYKSEKPSYAE